MDKCIQLVTACMEYLGANGLPSIAMAYACQYWCYHLASLLAITGGQTYIRSRKQLLKGFLGKIACQWLRHWLYNLKGIHQEKVIAIRDSLQEAYKILKVYIVLYYFISVIKRANY